MYHYLMIKKEDLEKLKVKPGDAILLENINNIVNALIALLEKIEEIEYDISNLELKG